jgi:hypothetical protein
MKEAFSIKKQLSEMLESEKSLGKQEMHADISK